MLANAAGGINCCHGDTAALITKGRNLGFCVFLCARESVKEKKEKVDEHLYINLLSLYVISHTRTHTHIVLWP